MGASNNLINSYCIKLKQIMWNIRLTPSPPSPTIMPKSLAKQSKSYSPSGGE